MQSTTLSEKRKRKTVTTLSNVSDEIQYNLTLKKALKYESYFTLNEYDKFIEMSMTNYETKKDYVNKIDYYNVPASFDIETTSFYENNEKKAIMYIWQFSINGYVIIGRQWSEFIELTEKLQDTLLLKNNRRLVVYVHNLSYEFQFMRKHFTWKSVFSIDSRKPIYAVTDFGIEFRCSYILSGYGLSKLGELVTEHKKYPVKKLTGNLDYELIRHYNTPITHDEMMYCINDVKVVCAYIQECIEKDGGITKIPLTKTGYVRHYVKNKCLEKSIYNVYKNLMSNLTLEPDEYLQLKSAFQGGFTHASCIKSTRTFDNVASFDFTSSYPTVLVSEKYPMSKGKKINIKSLDEFYKLLDTKCCMFDITYYNLKSKYDFEHIISFSKCRNIQNATKDNGRIINAEQLTTTITDVDFNNIDNFYTYDYFEINNMTIYDKGYLPKPIIESILTFYEKKTVLKNIENKKQEYNYYKELLNAIYGMIVTDIVRDDILYDIDWNTSKGDLNGLINKYNTSKRRVLFYPWGVWCTAYARRNLFSGILEFKDDYIYSDTDSIKVLNKERHMNYIERYNREIKEKLESCLSYYNIELERIRPKNKDNIEKPLGIWDYEGTYSRFKTLGAKRYLTEKNNDIELTVSGINKSIAIPKLKEKFSNTEIFNKFNDKFTFTADMCGKNTHTYVDNEICGNVTDYLGNKAVYHELSFIHLEKAEYNLSLTDEYKKLIENYIGGIKNAK